MAISKCKECGKEISSKATSCPHCGAKITKTSVVTWAVLGLIVVAVLPAMCTSDADKAAITAQRLADDKASQAAVDTKKAEADKVVERAIAEKQVMIGMTREQVIRSWGEPEKVNTTINARGTSEQFVYGDGQYLYLDDGLLRSIQK